MNPDQRDLGPFNLQYRLPRHNVCLFELMLYSPVNNFFSHVKMFSWVEPVLYISSKHKVEAGAREFSI